MRSGGARDWFIVIVLLAAAPLIGRLQNTARSAGRFDPVARTVQATIEPGARGVAGFVNWISDFSGGVFSGRALRDELRNLRAVEAASRMYAERVELYRRQVDELRRMQNLPEYPGKSKVLGDIVGLFPRENRITINVGENQGVVPGLPVITAAGMVGVVQVVNPNSSQVLLLSSVGLKIGALALRNPPVPGLLRGDSANTLILEFLDPQAPVQNGDLVVTSGYSEKIPRNIPIGVIIQIDDNPSFGMRRAMVFPAVNLGSIREVVVLK